MRLATGGTGLTDAGVAGLEKDVIARDAALQQEELDLTNIAPRRPNWDLHRDLEARLQRVQRRNKEAILTLIRTCAHAEGGTDQQASASVRSSRCRTWRLPWAMVQTLPTRPETLRRGRTTNRPGGWPFRVY